MDEIYLEIYSLSELCLAPIETIVTLFTMRYCDSKISIKLIKGKQNPNERAYTIDVSHFIHEVVDMNAIPYYASSCEFPSIIVNKNSCVAGLCAILRQIIKKTILENPMHHCRSLLGFKNSSLLACSEVSIWTKFCEVDLIVMLKSLTEEQIDVKELPSTLARFERHLSQPVRLHNLYKYITSKRVTANGTLIQSKSQLLQHIYAEGPYLTLADIIIFVCIHNLLSALSNDMVLDLLPLTTKWYERMTQNQIIVKCLGCLPLQDSKEFNKSKYTLPVVANLSLYKCDPKRYKPRNRIYTKQEDIDCTLRKIKKMKVKITIDAKPFGIEMCIDWSNIPYDATPEGGSLPVTRLKKKYEQLENLSKPIIKLAKPGDTIVDFCSGSGHLGILVAYLLPHCSIILLENKEESLNRAKKRVEKLKLTNIKFYQCNLDYFKGHFDIGTSLHACGVATDLVIQQCIKENAVFVSCPCCYGSVENCHRLTYPRSDTFKNKINNEEYKFISHAADQTHDKENAKTKQGYKCMAIIDTDRKLQAEQYGYKVYLSKLIPETCTSKNHILIGIPKSRVTNESNI